MGCWSPFLTHSWKVIKCFHPVKIFIYSEGVHAYEIYYREAMNFLYVKAKTYNRLITAQRLSLFPSLAHQLKMTWSI